MLYDSAVSRVAVQAMRNLHPELIASVQARTLYSKAEEDLLGTIKSVIKYFNLIKLFILVNIRCI